MQEYLNAMNRKKGKSKIRYLNKNPYLMIKEHSPSNSKKNCLKPNK